MAATTAAALLIACAIALCGPARADRPERIVSMNMCADQYLIALADKDQIAGLTTFARDAEMSFYAERAADYPLSDGRAETVLTLEPDLIIASPYRSPTTRALLDRFELNILELEPAHSFADIVAHTRQIAQAIGHPKRGEALIDAMRAELASMPPTASTATALHYQRRGFVTGMETLFSSIMRRVGLRNLAERVGAGSVQDVPLERVVVADPDYLITSLENDTAADLGTELLLHPLLRRQFGPERRLVLPKSLTVCGGPAFPTAVRTLREQIRARR